MAKKGHGIGVKPPPKISAKRAVAKKKLAKSGKKTVANAKKAKKATKKKVAKKKR